MTTQEVADRLIGLCREGKGMDAVMELYDQNIVSIEPDGAPNKETKGLEAVIEKEKGFYAMVEEMHGAEISDPIVADNFFSCSMKMDLTFKGAPRMTIEEVCVYQVNNGKIVREEFFFTPMPMG